MLYNKDWDKTKTDEARVILAAADILEEKGWCQFATHDEQGHMCSIGALSQAITDLGFRDKHNESLMVDWVGMKAIIEKHVGCKGLVDWNNAPGRTKEEVITAFRESVG